MPLQRQQGDFVHEGLQLGTYENTRKKLESERQQEYNALINKVLNMNKNTLYQFNFGVRIT